MSNQSFLQNLHIMQALRDARAASNAAARKAAQNNPQLVAMLLSDEARRGNSKVDWVEYFQNVGINYP